jgi:hypothetical protein
MDQTRPINCLKWNIRTTLPMHSEMSTPPSRRILDFLRRSHFTCCSACDLRFRSRKTRHSGYDCYKRFMSWYVRCYCCTMMRCELVHNRQQPRTSFGDSRCMSLQGTSSCVDTLTVSCLIDSLDHLRLRSKSSATPHPVATFTGSDSSSNY